MTREEPTANTRTTATAEVDGIPAARRVRQLVLAFGGACDGRNRVVLDGHPVVIGRDPGDARGVRLEDREVSRRHAILAFDAATDGWFVTDQGSRNGTFVDGVRCERAPVGDGSVLRIGRSILVFLDGPMRGDLPLRPSAPPLLGPSLAMQQVRGEIELVAPRDIPVLVLGETGVGKELVAAQIHARSGRGGPFVAVNCAAIAPTLAESELFGHRAGAFTGATQRHDGLFVAAHGGTLFLDEIAEMPLAIQAKLLRALAVGEVRPVGGGETRRVDVRVVAATHRDLAVEERAGTFRADLLARLSGWTIRVPPLRARRDDILPLAGAFLARQPGAPVPSVGAAEALLVHDWPRNVRELEQVLGAAVLRRRVDGPILREHLPDMAATPAVSSTEPAPPEPSRDAAPTRDELCRLLERHAGNVARVAAHFGKDRHQVYRWARRHGVDLGAYRRG